MARYKVRLSKEYGGAYHITIIEAENETDAFLKAVKEAKEKGIIIPDEVWTNIKKLDGK